LQDIQPEYITHNFLFSFLALVKMSKFCKCESFGEESGTFNLEISSGKYFFLVELSDLCELFGFWLLWMETPGTRKLILDF
jgi:hypothetical protein